MIEITVAVCYNKFAIIKIYYYKGKLTGVSVAEDNSTSLHDDDVVEPSNWKCTIYGKVFESRYILDYHILLEHSKYKRPPTGIG